MVGPFAVEGYDVLASLDADGSRWRAVCLADGCRVVLRRWTGAGARLAEVRRLAALWSSAARDGVIPVRDVVRQGDDLVVVTEAGGDALDAWFARLRTLTPGQVVTLVVPIAAALAAAHEHGLVHGRLEAASVMVDDTGRPRLTDYVFGGVGDPQADVTALVELARGCLDATAPAVLVTALESATDARGLADQVLASVPAEPLNVVAPAVLPVEGATTNRSRVRIAVALAGAVVVIAAIVGAWSGRREPSAGAAALPPRVAPTALPSSTPAPSGSETESLPVVVRDLELRRVHALAHADVHELATVEVRATRLWRRDSRVASSLVVAHEHLRGLRVRLLSVHVGIVSARHAAVRVVDEMSAYDVVDGNGLVVAHHPARQATATELALIHENGKWLLDSVR